MSQKEDVEVKTESGRLSVRNDPANGEIAIYLHDFEFSNPNRSLVYRVDRFSIWQTANKETIILSIRSHLQNS